MAREDIERIEILPTKFKKYCWCFLTGTIHCTFFTWQIDYFSTSTQHVSIKSLLFEHLWHKKYISSSYELQQPGIITAITITTASTLYGFSRRKCCSRAHTDIHTHTHQLIIYALKLQVLFLFQSHVPQIKHLPSTLQLKNTPFIKFTYLEIQ